MNREDLLTKLQNEKPLSAEEEATLDAELATQSRVSQLVRSLPSEEPSMEWRSRVQEQTQLIVNKARRAAGWPLRMAGVSLGAAIACAWMATFLLGRLDAPERVTTEAILNWHDEAVAASVLPGDGITLEGASALPSKPVSSNDLFDGGSLPSL